MSLIRLASGLIFLWLTLPAAALEDNLPLLPVTPAERAEVLLLPEPVNSVYTEYTPFILEDQTLLFFQSDRPNGTGLAGDFDLWFSRLTLPDYFSATLPAFSLPENPGSPLNSRDFDGHPALRRTDTGLEIFFTATVSPGSGRKGPAGTNIYHSYTENGQWTIPEPVFEINSDFNERMPSISPDGKKIYFSSDRPGGFGRDDIWVSDYNNQSKTWSKPRNLGPEVNTSQSEVSPSVHPDNITLFFSSDRQGGLGGYDIYVTQTVVLPAAVMFKKPQNLGQPYNSRWDDEYPTVTSDGLYMYYSSNREGGYGLFDIYRARIPDFAKPRVLVLLAGRVHELGTEKGLEANIRLESNDGTRNITTALPGGNYSLQLKNDTLYRLLVTAPGFEPVEEMLDLRNQRRPAELERNFALRRAAYMPEKFRVHIHFAGEDGQEIRPQATYRISPGMQQEDILPDNYYFMLPGKSKDVSLEELNRYLETYSLAVSAQLDGFKPLQEKRTFKEIIQSQKTPLREDIHYSFTMKKSAGESGLTQVSSKPDRIIYFELDVADRLDAKNQALLAEIKSLQEKNPSAQILLQGHTDKRGNWERNVALSKNRASYIRDQLLKAGIPAGQIKTEWYSSSRPAVPETGTEGNQLNRRVEVFLLPKK